ncbi:bifunctional NAD(P)H-hydrate repair enzyme [Mesorhizobium sp. L-8-10]|uniref:NAD(P)H-hydrate dehydratase n=1 Tax=Mesorhizobium sp. L-8-10 TaxID=2744523 RepID=UPI0019266E62|nr:NAD(P)H-hydrate dehydratase [Mesorhizobium sp. L-8-10]BCH32603.1 bifunctional NAD(P)H-hydrate repair enzyme [Mesorhizobium sp. L-8-10]
MTNEILTSREMTETDRTAIAAGPLSGIALMRNAGAGIARRVLARYPQALRAHILCGPGNNGGDGYVVARLLLEAGWAVTLWADAPPRAGSDAAIAAGECPAQVKPLAEFAPETGTIVIDALFGAGLSKRVEGAEARAIELCARGGVAVVAVDLPSGVSGDTGKVLGTAFKADLTVTFVRKKPGHLLQPGRCLCGEVELCDIGISDAIVAKAGSRCFENGPDLWIERFPVPDVDAHKYRRGHVGVFSGGPSATGAARLAAMAAARAGSGAVTVLSPGAALAANAAHLTSIMLRKADTLVEAKAFLRDRRPDALVFGPGLDPGAATADFAVGLIDAAAGVPGALVVDASALTSLARQPAAFFAAARRPGAPVVVLTPHEGEFARLFADIAGDEALSKLEKARAAAKRAAAIIVFKGPDSVVAAPDGRAVINANGTPLLATAGSGDVLSGIVAGLAAQGMPAFEAACAAVWLHAEAARRFGPGLIAEDLPLALLPVLRDLVTSTAEQS